MQAAGLLARLLSLPDRCLAAQIATDACARQSSWVNNVLLELSHIGVAPPASWGITAGTPRTVVKFWLRQVRDAVTQHSNLLYRHLLQSIDSLECYARWQSQPHLHRVVYRHACPIAARFWGLARCGHHDFSDGRSSRHRRGSVYRSCRFCADGPDTLSHAFVECVAYSQPRQRWQMQTRSSNVLNLETLFSTDPVVNSSRDILRNIVFVANVCRDASAWEM